MFKDILFRLLAAAISFLSGKWAYQLILVLFGENHVFDGGDPFVIILIPFLLGGAVALLGLIILLVYISIISATYAISPNFCLKFFMSTK